jgi:broad specificity phosphatase PhoE
MVCPSDPNKEHVWEGGFGTLTPLGRQQMFQLGKQLRWRYMDHYRLVSPSYRPEEVFLMIK